MNEIEAQVTRLVSLSRKLRQVVYAAPSDALREALSAKTDAVRTMSHEGPMYTGYDWCVILTYTVDSQRQTGY